MSDKEEIVKNEILLAARGLFHQYGLKKTSMEDIAEKVGKGKSTLYYYFKNKEELFMSVLEMECGLMKTTIGGILQGVTGAKARIKTQVRAKINMLEELKVFSNYSKEMYLYSVEHNASAMKEYENFEKSLILETLLPFFQNGRSRIKSEEELHKRVACIAQLIKGIYMQVLFSSDSKDITDNIDSLIDIMLCGVIDCD